MRSSTPYLVTISFAITLMSATCMPSALAQAKSFFTISKYERRWAIFHPFAACRIKKQQKEMYAVYSGVKSSGELDNYASGGKLDAFRHVFAMAYFVRYASVRKLRKLGKAHEKGNFTHFKKGISEEGEIPDSISTVMDLRNNELGFILGCENLHAEISALRQKVIDAIRSGKAFILYRNSEGQYLDCNHRIIPPEKMKGTWQTPRCLVGSAS